MNLRRKLKVKRSTAVFSHGNWWVWVLLLYSKHLITTTPIILSTVINQETSDERHSGWTPEWYVNPPPP